MSPLTLWHYVLLTLMGSIFVLGVLLAFRSQSKFSILTTLFFSLLLFGGFSWKLINENVYRVELSHIQKERHFETEEVVFTGIIRNTGNYPVANVIATVTLVNSGSNTAKASQFGQSTAFAELFEGDDPDFKRQNIEEEHVIADYLIPGQSKAFYIRMEYPPYFGRASYDIEASAN